jgi:hypothetical protein
VFNQLINQKIMDKPGKTTLQDGQASETVWRVDRERGQREMERESPRGPTDYEIGEESEGGRWMLKSIKTLYLSLMYD